MSNRAHAAATKALQWLCGLAAGGWLRSGLPVFQATELPGNQSSSTCIESSTSDSRFPAGVMSSARVAERLGSGSVGQERVNLLLMLDGGANASGGGTAPTFHPSEQAGQGLQQTGEPASDAAAL